MMISNEDIDNFYFEVFGQHLDEEFLDNLIMAFQENKYQQYDEQQKRIKKLECIVALQSMTIERLKGNNSFDRRSGLLAGLLMKQNKRDSKI